MIEKGCGAAGRYLEDCRTGSEDIEANGVDLSQCEANE